jgi:iron complex outermembrane receptor protein
MGTTKCAAILLLAVVAAPAAADERAPSSLRMRDPATRTRSAPLPVGRRVAQRPPDPPPGDPPDAPPAGDAPATSPPGDAPGTPPAANAPATPPARDAPAVPPASAPAEPPPPPAPPASPVKPARPPGDDSAPSTGDDGKTEVISVTGATVERERFTGRAPVSVVTRADLAASGRATLGDILQALPAVSNAGNAQVNAGGDGTTRINLRGLGAPRTLVLINGRRMVNGGNGADAAVDVNAIPLAMIERVEVLKDGASALYGADAVGGVVNLITRPQFDGADVSLLTSTSQRGDGIEYDASVVTGFTTEDRHTYLVVSGGYQHHDPVFAGDRAFSQFQHSYDFASRTVTSNASLATPSGRLDASSIGPGGMHPSGCGSDTCKPTGTGWADFTAPADLYNDAAQNYLYTPSTRYNVFATAGNRINDHAAALVELLYLHRSSDRQLSPVAFIADSPISKDSLYNPLGGDILDYRRRITELGPRQFVDTVSTIRAVVGITGSVPASVRWFKDWNYELSSNFGETHSLVGTTGQLFKRRPGSTNSSDDPSNRVADALGPSMLDARGVPICVSEANKASTQIIYRVPLESGDTLYVPCVPLNLLAPAGMIPSDQLKNLTFSDAGTGTDNTRAVLATASGRIARLPNHGDISVSLGLDARNETGNRAPPSVASAGYTTDNEAHATDGQFDVYEGFGELAIVPITGGELAQRVELDLGARALRHTQFGTHLTYKAGGLVRTTAGLAVRGTYATAFRAPSVFDLVGGRTERLPTVEDPCDTRPPSAGDGAKTLDPMTQARCTAQGVPAGSRFTTNQQPAVIGGNPDLQAETAATATVGIVFEPSRLKGLALSADYWRIAIAHAIESLGIQTIFANCYERGIQAFCDQVHRDSTHRIFQVDQFLQNVPRTVTSGIDVALWYDARLPQLGRIHTGLEAQYLLRYDLETSGQAIHGVGFYDLGVYPRFKANLSSHWAHPGGASAGFLVRFVGSYQECAGNDCNNPHNLAAASRDVDRYAKLDLYGGYDFPSRLGKTTLQVGINNVFDATPPVVYNAPAANSDATTYDFVGRMIYLRMSQLF